MFVYEDTSTAREHRLTLAMCLCLLMVGNVRPSTWAALVRRGLAEQVAEDGPARFEFTPSGRGVADALVQEACAASEDVPGDGPATPEGDGVSEDRPADEDDDRPEEGPALFLVSDRPEPADAPENPARSSVVRAHALRQGDRFLYRGRSVSVAWTAARDDVVLVGIGNGVTLETQPDCPVRMVGSGLQAVS